MQNADSTEVIDLANHVDTSRTVDQRHRIIGEPEEDINLVLNQIKHDNCSLPELERHWSATVKYRLNTIKKATSTQEIIKEWPSYMIPMGYKLIDIDFKALYPNCYNILGNYEIKLEKIFGALMTKVKDCNSRNILKNFTDIENPSETEDSAPTDPGLCGKFMTGCAWALVVITFPLSLFVCFKVVQEYERAVIFRLGRLVSGGAKGPGIFFILPCIDNYARVDLRTRTYDVPPQEVLTKDSVTVSVDAVVYYRVCNATISVANVANAHQSTRLLAQTTLRNVLGTRPLHEILSDRDAISKTMQVSLDEATESWGIKVERVEIKDVRLPVQLQRAMAAEAEAAREARAKVIAAEGEQKASRALREASEVISDSPAALQLRYLQTLNTISAEKNSTIVFPLPIDIISFFTRPREPRDHRESTKLDVQNISS